MPAPPPPQPLLRPVRAGDEITVEVEGGFVRRHAPSDGLVVQTPERDVFLPVEVVVEAMRLLGLRL